MCMAIPMRIVAIEGLRAQCEARGSLRMASLVRLMHEELAVGDYVAVHSGSAIARMAPEEAEAAWALFDTMTEALAGGVPGEPGGATGAGPGVAEPGARPA